MQITFVSNYINHHQLPFCMEMKALCGDFLFLETERMPKERRSMGWDSSLSELDFVVRSYDDQERAERLIVESDVVIFGGCEDQNLIIPRLKKGLFTIRYSERLYKEGRYKFISPRGLIDKFNNHIRYGRNNSYMLAAGAYTAGDFKLIHAYRGKIMDFGYFPRAYEYEDVHALRRGNDKLKLLWVSRLIDWKHPELIIKLAQRLRDEGKEFTLTMVGNGPMEDEVDGMLARAGLKDLVSRIPSLTPDEIRNEMLKADIFVLTSDGGEGWGAVINEAMNSGAAVVASNRTGAAPMLITNGKNGCMFKSGDLQSLYGSVVSLMNDKDLRYKLGSSAYETITGLWSPKVAAERLYGFILDKEHKIPDYREGPLKVSKYNSFYKTGRNL